MFSRELEARASKLTAEQRARAERERQRLEKERVLQERQRERERQREEEQQQKRLEEIAAEERRKEQVFHDTEHNRGVYLQAELSALPLDESAMLAKGVRRSKDKLLLPPSIGASLMSQSAPKNGAMMFELSLPGNPQQRTHASVLEFSAPEGTVLLPRKVVQSLWGSVDAQPPHGNTVVLTYRRLEKAEYVRLQPMAHGFHEAIGGDMRQVLEEALMGHATLTEGDWLAVKHAGTEYSLRVQELRPGPAASVIDTDVVADVVPSLESEQYLARWEEEQRQAAARLEALAAERAAQEQAELQRQQQLAEEAAAQAAADAERRERARTLKAAALPLEPPVGEPQPHATLLFRLPDGSRLQRRFLLTQPVQLLFDYVDSAGAGGLEPGAYALVTRVPRRVLEPGQGAAGRALGDVGLAAGAQEAFFVEPMEAPVGGSGDAAAGGGAALMVQ